MDTAVKLNEMFDHIYCINLDARTDRWEECEKEFAKLGLEVERFSACTGHDVIADGINFGTNLGEAGLVMSHRKILQDAVVNNYRNILILEDDIEFAPDVEKALDHVPDNWDVIYFGGNHAWGYPIQIDDVISVANRTLAMHCVGIDRRVFQNMLNKINYNVPIDVTYAHNLHLMNSYVFYPSKAWQRPSWSDLTGQYADYGFLR